MKVSYFIVGVLFSFIFSSYSTSAQNLNNGLIAHYLFNKDVQDHSGNNNHGAMRGGLQFDEDRFGNKCGALNFNGVDGYVEVPSSRSLESPTNQLSVAVWFRLDPGATDLKWLTVCCKSNIPLETNDSPQYRMQATRVTLSVNTEFTENLNADVDFGVWHHYTMVYDGSTVTAYLNGRAFFDFPYFSTFSPNRMPLEVGRDVPGVLEYFAGSMDDLRIYNRALSVREVRAVYNDDSERTSPKPCAPPPAPTPPAPAPPSSRTPPVVTITDPAANPFQSGTPSHELKATIDNIFSANDVVFRINGQNSKDFTFNRRTREFRSTVPLPAGKTFCEIIATNNDGRDMGTAILEYAPPAGAPPAPPVITIRTPAANPHQAPRSRQQVVATITNIQDKRDIGFRLNGAPVSGFSFDSRAQTLRADVSLVGGNNIFEISASNKDGSDYKSGIIRYEATLSPPRITVTLPTANPHEVSESRQQIKARIENVSGRDDIQFRFNGKPSTAFSYDAASQSFITDQPLEMGYNAFEIVATNTDGRDSKTGSIIYRPTNGIPVPDVGEVTVKEEVVVKTPTIKLVCYDHKKEDGDIVSIIINGEVVVDQQELKAIGNGEIVLDLPPFERNKEYILISKAWNLGAIPPNTMTLKIYDGGNLLKTLELESEIGRSEAIRLIYRG